MIIELYGQEFTVYGYPVIENGYNKAIATDHLGNVVVLMWAVGKEPTKGNVILTRVEK